MQVFIHFLHIIGFLHSKIILHKKEPFNRQIKNIIQILQNYVFSVLCSGRCDMKKVDYLCPNRTLIPPIGQLKWQSNFLD